MIAKADSYQTFQVRFHGAPEFAIESAKLFADYDWRRGSDTCPFIFEAEIERNEDSDRLAMFLSRVWIETIGPHVIPFDLKARNAMVATIAQRRPRIPALMEWHQRQEQSDEAN